MQKERFGWSIEVGIIVESLYPYGIWYYSIILHYDQSVYEIVSAMFFQDFKFIFYKSEMSSTPTIGVSVTEL